MTRGYGAARVKCLKWLTGFTSFMCIIEITESVEKLTRTQRERVCPDFERPGACFSRHWYSRPQNENAFIKN